MWFSGKSDVSRRALTLRVPGVSCSNEIFSAADPLSFFSETTSTIHRTAGGMYGDEFRPD